MSVYSIIQNEPALVEFIETVLPETNGFFYLTLMARKKWCAEGDIKSDKSQLKRLTSRKALIVEKIRQLETTVGTYKIDGIAVPQEALGLYITPNERNNKAATFELMQSLLLKIQNNQFEFNLHQEALSALQKSGIKTYFDLDIDFADRNTIDFGICKTIGEILNPEALTFIRTRGGFHVLVRLESIAPTYKKSWFNAVQKAAFPGCTITMNGDNLIPVVGCCQGGFVPELIQVKNNSVNQRNR
jgi:hypothetical protein